MFAAVRSSSTDMVRVHDAAECGWENLAGSVALSQTWIAQLIMNKKQI